MKVYDFLKENQMLAESFDPSEIERVYFDALKTKNTLDMINSYQVVKQGDLPKDSILTIDAGGTNLRFCLYRDGSLVSEDKMPMFGAKEPIPADDFFRCMAEEIDKYDVSSVGFCFAYPCEILPNKDARILKLTKEVRIDGIEGKVLGEEINKRLERKRIFSVLNDTVAAQLGVAADVGIIIGTGFNICYTDKRAGVIIDTETGQYKLMPEGVFDKALDKIYGSDFVAERQISGAYLAPLIKITSEGYFGREMPDFELSDVSEFLLGCGKLKIELSAECQDDFREIAELIIQRGASRVALMLKCLLDGYDSAKVALEGSTVYKLPGYLDALKKQTEEFGLSVDFLDARGCISIGCVRSLM